MKVAVLLPVHNGAKTIERSIKSLLAQTYNTWRLVLVDNNCTDDTVKIVKRLMDAAQVDWTLLTCSTPGIVPALNKGLFEIMRPEVDLVARLDADDLWHPTKLEKQVAFMERHSDIHILGTQITRVSPDNFSPLVEQIKYPELDTDIRRMLFSGSNAIAHPSVVFRPEVILRTGGYDNTYPIAEDYHLWLKAAGWFNFANLEDTLVDYTVTHNPKYNPKCPQLCCLSMRAALEHLH